MQVKAGPQMDEFHYRSLLDGYYYEDIRFPITFHSHRFKALRSFLFSCWGEKPLLISSDFKAQLEIHGITGWKTFPVRLLNNNGEEIPGYHGFTVTGRGGPRDLSKSALTQKRYHPKAPLADIYKGIFLKPEEWDGSDIFLERKYWTIMISDKAAKIFKKQKALQLTPLAEMEVPKRLFDQWGSDYRLTYSSNDATCKSKKEDRVEK